MNNNVGEVIIPPGLNPEQKEKDVAKILAKHYSVVIEFIKPSDGFKIKTPDIVMNGVLWEIKNPRGQSRKNIIRNQFSSGGKQSRHLVINGQHTSLNDSFLVRAIQRELTMRRRKYKVIFITKDGDVIEINRGK